MAHKNASELDRAVEDFRGETAQQPGLPALLPEETAAARPPERSTKGGRPVGATNLHTPELARIYRGRYGDPLAIATEIATKNVLAEEVVIQLAKTWGCTRYQAVQLWQRVNADANSYHHQKMPQAVILPPGAPGSGERIGLVVEGVFHQVAAAPPDDAADGSEAA